MCLSNNFILYIKKLNISKLVVCTIQFKDYKIIKNNLIERNYRKNKVYMISKIYIKKKTEKLNLLPESVK